MSKFFDFLTKTGKAKEFKGLTNWLVNQPWFRDGVLKTHKISNEGMKSMENYLDEELLGKKQTQLENPSQRDKDI